ncbi:hypothetical protein [Deinococcus aquaedulcis]|uniref:hypothetical protein n=1 Tax=Deinococcus aquaedulcis TaxID=2840455 RepID=UPI001C82CDF3|nr:hypothetical protein [Deinococcus aquaedulcis]
MQIIDVVFWMMIVGIPGFLLYAGIEKLIKKSNSKTTNIIFISLASFILVGLVLNFAVLGWQRKQTHKRGEARAALAAPKTFSQTLDVTDRQKTWKVKLSATALETYVDSNESDELNIIDSNRAIKVSLSAEDSSTRGTTSISGRLLEEEQEGNWQIQTYAGAGYYIWATNEMDTTPPVTVECFASVPSKKSLDEARSVCLSAQADIISPAQ